MRNRYENTNEYNDPYRDEKVEENCKAVTEQGFSKDIPDKVNLLMTMAVSLTPH